MTSDHNKKRSRGTARSAVLVCAALLIAVALLISSAAAAAPADNSHPPVPEEALAVLITAGAIVLAFLIWGVLCLDEVLTLRRTKAHWDRLLVRALAVASESNNFSDSWFAEVASQYGDAILKQAAWIEDDAAERKLAAHRWEAWYRRIADYAAERHTLDKNEVFEMLRKTDNLRARLLEECRRPRKELPAPNTKGRVWINPSGEALSFLPMVPPKRRKRRDTEREKDQKVWKEHECEVHALDHEIEVAKRHSVKASWNRKARDMRQDLAPPPPAPPDPLERAWRKKQQEKDLVLQEHEVAADLGGEKVTRAKTQAIEVDRNLHMTKGEKRTRILEIMDAYELDESILPPAIRELLEEEEFHDE